MGSMLHEQHPNDPATASPEAMSNQQKSLYIPQTSQLDGGSLAKQPTGGEYFQSLSDYLKNREGAV